MFRKDFHKIEFFEKGQRNLDFGSVLGGQSDEKSRKHSVAKTYFFRTMISVRFFIDFSDFGSILGDPGTSKNCKESLKIDAGACSESILACDMILVVVLKRFLQILDGFWKGSGGILEGLWRDNK